LFKDFVAFLKELSLYGAKQVAVDGTKLKAANSTDKAFNQKALAKKKSLVKWKKRSKEAALTDPDCRQMMNHSRVESCYNGFK
jgi:hypothetical protein